MNNANNNNNNNNDQMDIVASNNNTSVLCLSNEIRTKRDKYYLFYKSAQNEVIGISFPTKEFINLTTLLNAPLCHSPTFFVCYGIKHYTSIHIVYFDNMGNLIEIYKGSEEPENNLKWKKNMFNNWSSMRNLPKGRGIPVMIPNNGVSKHIYYISESNDVIMIRHGKDSNWKWIFTNLTEQRTAPLCFGNFLFAVRGVADATNKHVIYQGENRNLIEIYNGKSTKYIWKYFNHVTQLDQFPTMLPWNGTSQEVFWKTTANQIVQLTLPNDQKQWQFKYVNLTELLSLPPCISSLYSFRHHDYDHLWFYDQNNQLIEIYRKNNANVVGQWNVNQFHTWDCFRNLPKVSGNLLMIPFNNHSQQLFWISENKLHRIHLGQYSSFKWEFQTLFDLSNPSFINSNDINLNASNNKSGNSNLNTSQIIGDDLELTMCCICLSKERTHVVVPCGHKCLCADCAHPSRHHLLKLRCPICRASFSAIIKEKEIKRYGTTQRFSDSVVFNGTVYLVEVPPNYDADITTQTREMLESVEKLLIQAGSDKTRILMATIYLADMKDYDAMNSVWDEWLVSGTAPTRACVNAILAKPTLKVEIALTAAVL